MSGVKHTPWKHEWVEESSDWAVFGCVYPPDADGIAHQPGICTLSDFCDEDEARLIAAAPDLLEALEAHQGVSQLLAELEFCLDEERGEIERQLRDIEERARDAIARARGEQDGGGE